MSRQITITAPDDWHLHFRDEEMLQETVPATARCFKRAIVMPNLVPPVTTANEAVAYKNRIESAIPDGIEFKPLMTIYLTNQTTAEQIIQAQQAGVTAAKYYPAGATTNSDAAVSEMAALYDVFATMESIDMPLLIHGEVTNHDIDIFDREKVFIDRNLAPLAEKFPNLRIILEHITTADAVDFVKSSRDRIGATITPQHLMLNRNDLLVGGIRPHNYCLPVLKRNTHQQALRDIVSSGDKRFFLGTDSAPHELSKKESACGCAGCYSAWSAIELYTQVFDELDALEHLEGFASFNGADFYQLPRNNSSITLIEENWTIPESITLPNGQPIVPFFAGQTVRWKMKTSNI